MLKAAQFLYIINSKAVLFQISNLNSVRGNIYLNVFSSNFKLVCYLYSTKHSENCFYTFIKILYRMKISVIE